MDRMDRIDDYVDERDFKLLEQDRYTFYVLHHIISGNWDCKILLSDHERMILCYSDHPFPIWIWTPDDATEDEMEKAYQLAKENSLLGGEYKFNMKYDLAEYVMNRAEKDGYNYEVFLNMFAYDCQNPIEPISEADGKIYQCQTEDVEELVELMDLFHKDTGVDQKDREGYREDAKNYIDSGKMFFWKNNNDINVACCKYDPTENMASVNLVFTRPEYRRKHYAEHLVYQVTSMAREEGYTPMLYTNADYTASNACYEKIGYVLQGKLCTIYQRR